MQINVTGHHVELTDGLTQAVTQKCKKVASHYPDISTINVVLTVDKNTQTVEATTHYLGQDIVANHQVSRLAVGDQISRRFPTEKPYHGRHTGGFGHRGHVGCRLDAEDWDAVIDEMAQQVAVVTGDVDHQALAAEGKTLASHGRKSPGVGDPALRIG